MLFASRSIPGSFMLHEHVLLVEGINDLHAVRNLVYRHGGLVHYEQDHEQEADPADCSFEIKQAGGWGNGDGGGMSNLSKMIRSHLKAEDILTLGVVADADSGPATCWEGRINDLFKFGDNAFTTLDDYDTRDGWIGETQNSIGDPVRVGLWVMPDNESEGALEDFAVRLIPASEEDQYLWDYAVDVVDGLEVQRFRDADRGKAQMHSWLAWQDPPRELIGRSISRETGGLDPHSDLALRFVDWIRQLFPARAVTGEQ